jgi:hypothetical protein
LGRKGTDTIHKLSIDAKDISTLLFGNRVIDVDTNGGEGESVVIVANMVGQLNPL